MRHYLENIKFNVLYPLIKKHIADNDFEALVYKFFEAGYTINNPPHATKNILWERPLSLIFTNIIIYELNIFIIKEKLIINNHQHPPTNPKYIKTIKQNINPLRPNLSLDVNKTTNTPITRQTYNNLHTPLKFVSYTNNFILGIAGTKQFSKQMIININTFLSKNLKLKLSSLDKTKITNIAFKKVLFLGTWIHKTPSTKIPPQILISAPIPILVKNLTKKGIGKKTGGKTWKPSHVGYLIHFSDKIIVDFFYTKWKKLWNYYKNCDNATHISKIIYLIKYSCAATLSIKYTKNLRSYKIVFKKYGKHLTIEKDKKVLAKFKNQSFTKIPSYKNIKT